MPSLFLFLPVAYLFNYLLLTYKKINKAIYSLTIILMISIISFFSISTYMRNQAWKDDITLWTDAVAKAPNNARASNILAIKLAWGESSIHPKRYDMALKLFENSLEKHLPSSYVRADIYGNMALIYFHKKNNPEKAFECFEKALRIHPGNLKIRRDLVNALIIQQGFDAALKHVDILLAKNSQNGNYHNLKGHILLWQGKYELSLSCFITAYEMLSDKTKVVFNTAVALSRSGEYSKAELLFKEGLKRYPKDMTFYFAIIENSIRAGEDDKTSAYVEKLRQQFSDEQIKLGIETYAQNPRYAPIDRHIIGPAISDGTGLKLPDKCSL